MSSIKWKAIFCVMLLVTMICAISILLYIHDEEQDVRHYQYQYSQSSAKLINFFNNSILEHYRKRIKNFVNPGLSPARALLIKAFADRDRAALLSMSLPFLENFRRENAFFSSMAWILPDNTVFLRVHKPELYGDQVTKMRPDIAMVNISHKQVAGFETGYIGLQYRFAQPVFYEKHYVGVLQIGIDAGYLLDTIKKIMDMPAGLLIPNKFFRYVTSAPVPSYAGHSFTLQSETPELFMPFTDMPSMPGEGEEIRHDSDMFVLLNVITLHDYSNNPAAYVLTAFNITHMHNAVRKNILFIIAAALLVILLSYMILRISFDKILGRIFTLNQSLVHEKENLKLRVEERTAALKDKAKEYEHIAHAVESSIDAIIFTDTDGHITYINRAAGELFGYSASEIRGRHAKILTLDKELPEKLIIPQLKSEGSWNGHIIFVNKNAKEIECFLSASLIRDRDDIPAGMLGIARDVTEIRNIEAEKAIVEAQLNQAMKMEAVGRLAGGIAHDFNNILNVINGYAELGLMEIDAEHPLYQKLSNIIEAGTKAARLTQQLLAFSRRQIITIEPLDLNGLVKELYSMMQHIIGEDIEIRLETAPGLWPVLADHSQFEQIIMNFAVNARDAMQAGGKLTIETANTTVDEDYSRRHYNIAPGDYVMLAISDTGYGMSSEVKERIFEPFYTTKEQGKGTGLGLATVYGIVKQNNGFIMVYSEPGQGTTFKILLPRADESDAVKHETAGHDDNMLHLGTEKIMLVEDDADVRKLTKEILNDLGYSVVEAESAEDALRQSEEVINDIDMLMTDIVMPGMNGPDLAKKFQEMRPSLKVLYMSGYTENAIVHKGILKDGISFLHKPFSIKSISKALRQVLNGDNTR